MSEGPPKPVSGAIDAVDATPSDEVPCGAEAELHVTIGPASLDPSQSQRVVEQVFSELAPQRAAQCAETDKGKRITRVEVVWHDGASAHVAVQAEDGARRLRRERDVDLSEIPADGDPLAIAIAADELLRDLREQLAEPLPPPPPPARIIRIDSSDLPLPLPLRVRVDAFGPAIAVETFTSGLTLIGPDARVSLDLAPHVGVIGRAGLRGVTASGGGLQPPRMAAVFGARFLLSPVLASAPFGIGVSLGVDAVGLRASSGSALDALLVPGGGLTFWGHLDHEFTLLGEVSAGAPLRAAHPAASDGPRHEASGVMVAATLGVGASF